VRSVDEVFVFLDLLTVSETAHDVVFDEGNGINSPTNLGLEATFINQNFSQQCLKRGPDKRVFSNPNPFVTDDDEGQVASVAYRYEDAHTDVSKCERQGCFKDYIYTSVIQQFTVSKSNPFYSDFVFSGLMLLRIICSIIALPG